MFWGADFKKYLLLIVACIIFSTCAKEYSYEGSALPNPLPVKATWICVSSNLNGEYTVGKNLDTSNYIQLKVNVTNPGPYSIITNQASGFSFGLTGIFQQKGLQTITLWGSGTPSTQGTLIFKPDSTSCQVNVQIKKKPLILADYTMSGSPDSCLPSLVNGTYVNNLALDSSNNVIVKVDVKTIGDYIVRTLPINGISFVDSGTFVKTGEQNIMLIGNGTPLQPDNLKFTTSLSSGKPGCDFSVTINNRDPIAIFTFDSSSNNLHSCIDSIGGNYSKNLPLNSSNFIKVNLIVTSIGNYTIASSLTNGIRFYHSGIFTVKGNQTVTLSGIGTPITSGVTNFNLGIIGKQMYSGQGCGFSLMVN